MKIFQLPVIHWSLPRLLCFAAIFLLISPPAVRARERGERIQRLNVDRLIKDGKLDNLGCSGTGKTIGHVADLKLRNRTNDRVHCRLPAMVLECLSKKSQDYICPREKLIDLGPNETKTVPIDGICGNRGKPPVGAGVAGDLAMNTGDPAIPTDPGCKIPGNQINDLVRICGSKYDAVEDLVDSGELKDFPYKDKEKQRDILIQWSTWTDPRVCQVTDATPATKEDLRHVVYKQVEEKGPMTPETKKKVDQGIDNIFDKVELTSAKAKDLEGPNEYAGNQPVGTDVSPGQTYEIADNTPTPGTEEKKKGKGGGKKKKKKFLNRFEWWQDLIRKFPFADWLEKRMDRVWADNNKADAADKYNQKFQDFLNDKKAYNDLKGQRDAAEQKANGAGSTQADKDAFNKLDGQLKKLENDFKKDFNQTDEGKKAFNKLHDAEKASDKAHEAEKDASKNIDPDTKQAVENYFKDNPPPPDLFNPPPGAIPAMW